MNSDIYVTKPFLPDFETYVTHLSRVWERGILTNNGPEHQAFEEALRSRLNVDNLSVTSNGTVALILALQALGLEGGGEVITTPFSFVATAHALRWLGLEPRFVDINPDTLQIDPQAIEAAITEHTRAIVPVHVFGHPCDVDAIDEIAKQHDLKVVYDAAHAFAVDCHCGSILNHGDASTLSFHATKIFNTFEGGAVICRDPKVQERVNKLKNFGFLSETEVEGIGINGKMAEPNAVMGLLQLEHIDEIIDKRSAVSDRYKMALSEIDGIDPVPNTGESRENFAYFPIRVRANYILSRDELYELLKAHGIFSRRYFYPLITDFPVYHQAATLGTIPNAKAAASEVICLPIYPGLSEADQDRVINVIRNPSTKKSTTLMEI